MTDQEIAELRATNARLMQEKAEAVAKWHEEVRATLAAHTAQLMAINANIATALALHSVVEKLERRVKVIEDFKLRVTAYMMGCFGVIAMFWKVVDRFWK